MKKLKIILLILTITILISSLSYYFFFHQKTETNLIGGDADEHNCLMSAGYSWCEDKDKCLRTWEEYCGQDNKELSFNFLKELKKKSGVNFSAINDTVFVWAVEKNQNIKEETINGLEIKATDSGPTTGLKNYFKNQGFTLDKYNIADGLVVGATGYQKDNLICLITASFKNFALIEEQSLPETEARYEIFIQCGELE